jgi:hypothetical protein
VSATKANKEQQSAKKSYWFDKARTAQAIVPGNQAYERLPIPDCGRQFFVRMRTERAIDMS